MRISRTKSKFCIIVTAALSSSRLDKNQSKITCVKKTNKAKPRNLSCSSSCKRRQTVPWAIFLDFVIACVWSLTRFESWCSKMIVPDIILNSGYISLSVKLLYHKRRTGRISFVDDGIGGGACWRKANRHGAGAGDVFPDAFPLGLEGRIHS